jgi:hypothetical protein
VAVEQALIRRPIKDLLEKKENLRGGFFALICIHEKLLLFNFNKFLPTPKYSGKLTQFSSCVTFDYEV